MADLQRLSSSEFGILEDFEIWQEPRDQRSEVRGQRAEFRSQRSEDRSYDPERVASEGRRPESGDESKGAADRTQRVRLVNWGLVDWLIGDSLIG